MSRKLKPTRERPTFVTGTQRAIHRRKALGWVLLVLGLPGILGAGGMVRAATAEIPPVETLVGRILGLDEKEPYTVNADFAASLTILFKTSRLTANAWGTFEESRAAGIKQRKATITKLQVPLVLRPLSGLLRKELEDRIEAQGERPDAFAANDFYIQEERPGPRIVLVGVRRDLVDEALDRYGRAEDKHDPAVRRRIAQWLFSTATMQSRIARPGFRYALRAVIDEGGTLYELTSFYSWGQVDTTYTYTGSNGHVFWRQVTSKFTYLSSSEQSVLQRITEALRNAGGGERLDAQIQITFANHCWNCRH